MLIFQKKKEKKQRKRNQVKVGYVKLLTIILIKLELDVGMDVYLFSMLRLD
jgi:hypothetical protein